MKRPSFQFYPADWRNNANLRRCSPAARGVWMDVLCVLHDSDEYGVVHWPLKELASAAGAPLPLLRELVDKRVLKGCDKGACEPFVYTPRSGRKDGDPVTLVPAQTGPIWYSSRFVRDEYVRTIRGDSSRFGEPDGATPKRAPKPPKGDGSTSSSSSSPSGMSLSPPAVDRDDRLREIVGDEKPTPEGAVCIALRAAGIETPNPSDPTLKALVESGATAADFVGYAPKAIGKADPFAYLLTCVVQARQTAPVAGQLRKTEWHETPSGIKAKGAELGIVWSEDGWVNGENMAFPVYASRVKAAASEGQAA